MRRSSRGAGRVNGPIFGTSVDFEPGGSTIQWDLPRGAAEYLEED
jgi:hypothetical protein